MTDYSVGSTRGNTIVRDCDCDDARFMKPWESRGHELDHVSRERSHGGSASAEGDKGTHARKQRNSSAL